jgi:hypothetical protein
MYLLLYCFFLILWLGSSPSQVCIATGPVVKRTIQGFIYIYFTTKIFVVATALSGTQFSTLKRAWINYFKGLDNITTLNSTTQVRHYTVSGQELASLIYTFSFEKFVC